MILNADSSTPKVYWVVSNSIWTVDSFSFFTISDKKASEIPGASSLMTILPLVPGAPTRELNLTKYRTVSRSVSIEAFHTPLES